MPTSQGRRQRTDGKMTASDGSIKVTANPVQMRQRMWTKVQWVRGFEREWKSADSSFQEFCYMVEKEV